MSVELCAVDRSCRLLGLRDELLKSIGRKRLR